MPNNYTAGWSSNEKDISDQFNPVRPLATPFLTAIMSDAHMAEDIAHYYQSQVLSSAWNVCPAGATNVATSITLQGTSRHFVGDILLVDATGELVTVTGVAGTNAAPILTITRATTGGAAAAAIPANGKLRIISRGTVEGEEGTADHVELSIQRLNFTQIFRKRGSFSGSLLAVKSAVMENDIAKQTENFIAQIKHEMEQAAVYGIVSGTNPRRMGGVNNLLLDATTGAPNNVTSAIGTLTLPVIDTAIANLFNVGGQPDTILTSTNNYNRFQTLAKTQRLFVQPDMVDYKNYFETYTSAYSPTKMKIIPSPAVADGDMFVLDSSKIRLVHMKNRKLTFEALSKTGDNVPFHVISEATLEFEAPAAGGWKLTGITG